MMFKWNERRDNFIVHVVNPEIGGSFCKVENGATHKKTVWRQSADYPPNHKKCMNCKMFKNGIEQSQRDKRRKLKNRVKLLVSRDFYDTEEWQRVRYEVLRRSEGCCMLCKRQAYKGNPLHVDHIKPRSKYPELALTISNLQVLCRACNMGKSNKFEDDWRPVENPEDTDWYRTHERSLTP